MRVRKIGLALIFSLLALPVLMISFQNFNANSPVQDCPASTFQEISSCLLQARPVGTILKIKILSNISLEPDQVIRIKAMEGITLVGAAGTNGDLPVIISESLARLNTRNHNSNYLIEILDGAKDIRVENLNIFDPPDTNLRSSCRTKQLPVGTIEVVDPDLCRPPMLVGGVAANAERITISKINITSTKQFLMAVRRTDGLTIENCQFTGGSVSGVFLQAGFRHFNTILHHNNFTLAGTAALSISDADTITVYSNKFINNHIDPQYTYALPDGTSKIYPGGQLYLGDAKSTEALPVGSITNVKLLSNELTMTDPYITRDDLGFPTTAGIEIMNGTNSGVEDVLVQWNKITGLPRSGISIHCPPDNLPCFKSDDKLKITVRDNVLYQNLRGFPALDERYGVNLEKNPHSGADVFLNSLFIPGAGYVKADLSNSNRDCVVDPVTKLCSVTIKASIENRPAGSAPVIRVNGALFKAFGSSNSIEATAPWIKKQTYVFSVHLNSNEGEPAIANWNVMGK